MGHVRIDRHRPRGGKGTQQFWVLSKAVMTARNTEKNVSIIAASLTCTPVEQKLLCFVLQFAQSYSGSV